MNGNGETGGGTPPPHFLQTNTQTPLRRCGGQPGNRNAIKDGQRTAEMNALRSEVRLAVQKAKALAAVAWCLGPSAGAGVTGEGGGAPMETASRMGTLSDLHDRQDGAGEIRLLENDQ
jgi:hypothetical protein